MDLLFWLPSLTTTGLFAAAVWLARATIVARLTRSIQHEFDRRLESVRSDLRASEEHLKAQLREKEAEISALRSGALSALVSRQAALDKRRLEAVDQLWAAFYSLGPARCLVENMAKINFEDAAKQAEHDQKFRKFIEGIGSGFDRSKIDDASANTARPFVSPMAWAIFESYRAITLHGFIRWRILKDGLGTNDFTNHQYIQNLIKTVLPHRSEHVKKCGPAAYCSVLDDLEQKLLSEFQDMLQGTQSNKANLEQVADINRMARDLQEFTDKMKLDSSCSTECSPHA